MRRKIPVQLLFVCMAVRVDRYEYTAIAVTLIGFLNLYMSYKYYLTSYNIVTFTFSFECPTN